MTKWLSTCLMALLLLPADGDAQPTIRYRSAVVALTDDAELRSTFEHRLVQKAIVHNYDAVASIDLEPDVADLDSPAFLERLRDDGVQAVLMLRPAAVGPGSSIESVRDQLSPEIFSTMAAFASAVSATGSDDLIAVVHMAIYTLDETGPTLVSAGAVWLDQEVANRDEGIERLQNLIVYNVNAVRPAIRRHLGLPPLERPVEL